MHLKTYELFTGKLYHYIWKTAVASEAHMLLFSYTNLRGGRIKEAGGRRGELSKADVSKLF